MSVLCRSRSPFLWLTIRESFKAVKSSVPSLCLASSHLMTVLLYIRSQVSTSQGLLCCIRPVFFCSVSLCQSCKYLILHRITTCQCCLYKTGWKKLLFQLHQPDFRQVKKLGHSKSLQTQKNPCNAYGLLLSNCNTVLQGQRTTVSPVVLPCAVSVYEKGGKTCRSCLRSWVNLSLLGWQ